MKTKSFRKINGEVESDESFIGGKVKNMHRSARKGKPRGGTGGKAVVHGMLERGGEVRCAVVPNAQINTLQKRVRDNIEQGSRLYTDSAKAYMGLNSEYLHQVVDHAREYVRGRVHTNSLENFWSLLKRSITGTYVAVAPKHLDGYLDEQAYRFNKRKGNDATRFLEAMLAISGKRLTYAELTSREAST